MNKFNKGISTLAGIIIVIALAIIAFGGVFAYQYFLTKAPSIVQPQQNQTVTQSCIPEGGNYGAPLTAADLCCKGLVEQPTDNGSGSNSGTVGICVKPSTSATISQSGIFGWNTYTNSDLGFTVNYPANYGMPTILNYGTTIGFGRLSNRGDNSMDINMDFSVEVKHDPNDGHPLTVAESMATHLSSKPITIDGRSGLTYFSSQIGTVTEISLGNNRIFTTDLDENNPTDKKILASIKFIPENPHLNFKLNAWSSVDTVAGRPGETRIDYSIFGSDIDSATWNGKWTLQLECPEGITFFSYGAQMDCGKTYTQPRWTEVTNPGGWFHNSTNKTMSVTAIARLIDNNGNNFVADQVMVMVPPSTKAN